MHNSSRRCTALALSLALVWALSLPLATAQAEAQIRGVLLDVDGTPAVGYQIGLKNEVGDLFLSAPTEADGHFQLAQIVPDRYRMVAFDPKGIEFPLISREVTLQGGQVERVEIRLSSGEGMSPGRTAAAPAQSSTSWWGSLSTIAKIGIVAAGAFAAYAVVDDDDDDDDDPSPSAP